MEHSPGPYRPSIAFLVAVFVALLFLLPANTASQLAAPTGAAPAPVAIGAAVHTVPVSLPNPTNTLAGSHPSGQYNDSAWVGQQWSTTYTSGLNALHAFNAQQNTSLNATLNASDRVLPAPPHAVGDYQTGTITGYINSSLSPLQGVSGVSVQPLSRTGLCPTYVCAPEQSNAHGFFSVTALAGYFDYLTFTASFFLQNYTYLTVNVSAGSTVFIGTTYLVPTAKVTGFVYVDYPTPVPLAGVVVTATTLNGTGGEPVGVSETNGEFVAALPPAPSKIQFIPPYVNGSTSITAYQGNFTWANATPGQTVDLGVVFLEPYQEYSGKVFDAVTKKLLEYGLNTESLQVCNSVSGQCGGQGAISTSGTVTALGPTGNLYAIVEDNGYLVDTQSLGYYGLEPQNHIDNLGNFYLMPPATLKLTVGLEYNRSSTQDRGNVSTVAGKFGTGKYWARVCGLDGYQYAVTVTTVVYLYYTSENNSQLNCMRGGCVSPGQTVTLPAFPLYDAVTIFPDSQSTAFPCAPPFVTWPIPGDLPVEPTIAWGNFTPDENTWINASLPVGSYVYGNVYVAGTKAPPPLGFTISANPTDYPTQAVVDSWTSDIGDPWDCPGYAQTASSFCVPVPPGPSVLTVNGAGNYSAETNTTWESIESLCCNLSEFPISLSKVNNEHVSSINLSSPATVSGSVDSSVENAVSHQPLYFASVQVCTVAGSICFVNVTDQNGRFNNTPALPGWNYITVSSSGYASNTVWVDVLSGRTNYVGAIPLTPLATLEGFVVDPQGKPVLDAHATYCPVTVQALCTAPLGTGEVTTGGEYLGFVPGGWLPWSTYKVVVSASGYSTDWTWANATANETTRVPTMVLYPTGANASNPGNLRAPGDIPHPSSRSSNTQTVWLTGRVIDASTDESIQALAGGFSVVSPSGALGSPFSGGTNTGGWFNQSIGAGLWNLNISLQGYFPVTVFVNATASTTVNAGTIRLTPWPFVQGNVSLAPWSSVQVELPGQLVNVTMAPSVNIIACRATGSLTCSASPQQVMTNSTGYYRLQTPGYGPVNLTVLGLYTVTAGANSAEHGFLQPSITLNVSENNQVIPGTLATQVFSSYTGRLLDGNGPGGEYARYAQLSFTWNSPQDPDMGQVAAVSDAQGNYTIFAAPFPGPTASAPFIALVGIDTAFTAVVAKFNESVLPGGTIQLPTMTLEHYGWIEFRVLGPGGVPVVDPTATTSSFAPTAGYYLTTSEAGNDAGWINVTAAPGPAVNVSVSAASGFNSTWFLTSVQPSQTTYPFGGSPLSLGAPPVLQPWGWIRSAQVNYTGSPVIPTIVDKAKGLPLPNAVATVLNGATSMSTSNPQPSNYEGQFFGNAPVGYDEQFSVSLTGYLSNSTPVNVAPGSTAVYQTINLTGDGIIAGRVIGEPSGLPINGASVTACPMGILLLCGTSTTNASGNFWVNATPNVEVEVSVSATGFNSNQTLDEVCSDCWTSLSAPIQLEQFATVSGYLRGLPTGLLLNGASVSACFSRTATACLAPVTTDPSGYFVDTIPAGNYWFEIARSGYESTGLSAVLVPGEDSFLGVLFLYQFGSVAGVIEDAATAAPVPGATIALCGATSGATCSGSALAASDGTFVVSGIPGPSQLVVSAAGFANAFISVRVSAGVTSTLRVPVLLIPLGVDRSFSVTGSVASGVSLFTTSSGPLGDAVVSLLAGTVPAASAETGSNGSFLLNALTGSYTLVAIAPGYAPVRMPVTVSGPQVIGTIRLLPATYNVTGTVRDGLTGAPLPGVGFDLVLAGTALPYAAAGANGQFSLALPNGTWGVIAEPSVTVSVPYAPAAFNVSIAGLGFAFALTMLPPTSAVHGLVTDRASGLPIAGASVLIVGTAVDGYPEQLSLTADAAGAFSVALPDGNYNVTASAPGYTTYHGSLVPTGPTSFLAIPLVVTPSAASGGMVFGGGPLVLLGIAAVAVAAVLVPLALRPRVSPTRGVTSAAPRANALHGGNP
jgi:Carboxypeptidase regulatory-like domain